MYSDEAKELGVVDQKVYFEFFVEDSFSVTEGAFETNTVEKIVFVCVYVFVTGILLFSFFYYYCCAKKNRE